MKRILHTLIVVVPLCVASPVVGEVPRLEVEAAKLGIPYHRYTTKDLHGRTITFYLSATPGNTATKLPVVLIIEGSGCQSAFQKHGNWVGGGFQNLLLNEAKGRVRVLIVEKPGVKYLDQPPRPGTAEGASREFLKEHTLPRWAAANIAALDAVWTLPEIDASRTLVVGHSEGGVVAARVAAERPQVTHVASLAGDGPTQLFDFIANSAQPRSGDKPGDAERRAQKVYQEWADIQKDPDSISRFWMSHPYRRWSSFLRYSVTEELLRTKARVYVASGTRDPVIPIAAHDMLVSELRARGHDVTEERVDGADHGFQTKDMPKDGPPVGMQALFGRVLRWFLGEAKGK
jgi:pimeloyl-ACP methyl ester carboxylesterase